MTSLTSKQSTKLLVQRLAKACDGDVGHAKQQLKWLKEKITHDRRGAASSQFDPFSKSEEELLEKYVNERVYQNKPLQYILGTQPFYDLEIVTRPPTLIPRWETEEWTIKLVELMRKRISKSNPFKVLDVCTGSGCIALALAKHLPKDSADILGLDISSEAISLANQNLKVHKPSLQNQVQFQEQDIFDYNVEEPFNLVISNPPYITNEEYDVLDPDIKDWEDSRALVAEEEGTRVHKRVIQIAKDCPSKAEDIPRLIMEIGGTHQVETLSTNMQQNGFKDIQVWKDLADKDRVIIGY